MNTEHAIQILIKGQYLAEDAFEKAGGWLQRLADWGTNLGKSLLEMGKLGTAALGKGLAIPAQAAVVAIKALWMGIQVLTTVLTAALAATAALTAGLAALAGSITAGIVAATEYAMRLENMYNAMWGIQGEAAPAMMDALKEASAFMVTQDQLLRQHNQSYMLLGKTLTDRLPEAYRYLTKVAQATGDDVSFLVERLTRSVGRLSTRWMAYVGTVVSLEEAIQHGTEMFNKQAEALTYEEKQAAMLDRVLEKLEARTAALPDVVGTANQMWMKFATTMKNTWIDVGRIFLPAAQSLGKVINRVADSLARTVHEGGVLYPTLRKLSATFTVLFEILGEVVEKLLGVEEEVGGRFESFLDKIMHIAWEAFEWGANIITNLAAGIIGGASDALTKAMNFVSGLLEWWLAPGSPPRIASNLPDWGASAFTSFLEGFSNAQFDVLEKVQQPLKQALSILTDLEMLGEIEGFEMFLSLSEDMAAAMDEFAKTGNLSSDIFAKLGQVGGGYGEALAELFRRQLDVASATEIAAKAEERLNRAREQEETANKKLSKAAREYNKMVREGADPALLKAKLAEVEASYDSLVAAREETEQAEEAKKQADETLKQKREQAREQERLLAQLIEMGRMMAKLAAARKKEEEEGYTLPEIEWPELQPPNIDEAFEELKRNIRAKFEELWASLVEVWEESGVAKSIEALGGAWERFKEAMQPVLDFLQRCWDILAGWVADEAWPWVLEQWDNWRSWWEENGPIIGGWLKGIGQTVADWVTDEAWPWIQGVWEGWKSWWEENGPEIKEGLSGLRDTVAEWMTDEAWPWVLEEWGKWKAWWEEDGPEVEKAINIFFEAWKLGSLKLLHWAHISFEGFKLGLELLGIDIDQWLIDLENWFTGGTGRWPTIWEMARGTFYIWWHQLSTAASGGMSVLRTTITTLALGVQGDWQGFVEGLRDIWTTVFDTLDELLFGALSDAIASAYLKWQEFYDLGSSMVNAITSSISNAYWDLRDSLEGVIGDVISDIKNFLGIHSESTVFYSIGENMVSGLAAGIADSAAMSMSAMTNVAAGLSTAAATAGPGGAAAPVSIVVHNHFGRDSVRNEQDIIRIKEDIERSMRLRGVRDVVG